MISVQELKNKAGKSYLHYLSSWVAGNEFTRIVIPCDKKVSDDFATFQQEIQQINSFSKETKGYGYSIRWQTVNKKALGQQDIPQEISFDTETDLLKFLRKESEAARFKQNVTRIVGDFPVLREWLAQHPQRVIEWEADWDDLLKVLRYFEQHPQPHLYIRELPIAVHTKFIESHKECLKKLLDVVIADHLQPTAGKFEDRYHLKSVEPLVRMRLLDPKLSRLYCPGISDLSIPVSELTSLAWDVKEVFIVENQINFLTFPLRRNSLVIWGHGYGLATLKNVAFLQQATLYYWGDLDAQGFEILSQMRGYFPHTQSLLMDKATFYQFFQQYEGTQSQVSVPLHLTPAENELYRMLKEQNQRLEQEKIPQQYLLDRLAELPVS